MRTRFITHVLSFAAFSSCVLLPISGFASPQGQEGANPGIPTGNLTATGSAIAGAMISTSVDVHVTGPDGVPVLGQVIVTLKGIGGQVFDQKTTKNSSVTFGDVPQNEYTILVIAPRYQSISKTIDLHSEVPAKVTIELRPMADAEDAAASVGILALPPRTQKEVGKALEALRANKPNRALGHLQAAQKTVPTSAEIEFLFSVYAEELKDPVQTKAYWKKTLELDPKHLSTLLAVGQDYLQEKKPAEALPYLQRAIAVEPASWRAQALLSEAEVLQGRNDDATKHALRAIELGHDRASAAQLVLARVLVQKGEIKEAILRLEVYVRLHPADKDTANYLEKLKNPVPGNGGHPAAGEMSVVSNEADALPVPSNWLPPDIDSSVPPVEPGASCNVDDVVRRAGEQLKELVRDVDRFTATETLVHQSIDKYGIASSPEKRTFNYVASIQEVQKGFLNVEEYRSTPNGGAAEFPGGVATNGLPAMVLIFHPANAGDFTMTCEGLARLSGGLAWQVHFRQRPDKPNVIKRYRIGADGPSYPVALKGRAWISADTYQILRLETDLVAPVKQIRLAADRADIEYGPVKFARGNVTMWLPKSADVYYDWMGRRIHRRHTFSDYLLFGVDDRQKISVPKADEAPGG
ncbi:MAG: tetratricopeptide repeat protein [Candidatus Acidiferrum sp.]